MSRPARKSGMRNISLVTGSSTSSPLRKTASRCPGCSPSRSPRLTVTTSSWPIWVTPLATVSSCPSTPTLPSECLLGGAIQHQGGHLALPLLQPGSADVQGLDAQQLTGFRVAQYLAPAMDAVTAQRLVEPPPGKDFVAGPGDQMALATAQHIGGLLQLLRTHYPGAAEKGIDGLQGQSGNGAIQRLAAHSRPEPHIAVA